MGDGSEIMNRSQPGPDIRPVPSYPLLSLNRGVDNLSAAQAVKRVLLETYFTKN